MDISNHIPTSNVDLTIFIRVINQWNQLPEEIVRCTTLNCFKSQINYFNDNK